MVRGLFTVPRGGGRFVLKCKEVDCRVLPAKHSREHWVWAGRNPNHSVGITSTGAIEIFHNFLFPDTNTGAGMQLNT